DAVGVAGGSTGGAASASTGFANPSRSARRKCDMMDGARHGTAHPIAADVNKTGATLADRSRVSILLLLQLNTDIER
ncbi:hypothetical protein, partial [Xanthomonas phaseoli]